MNNIPSIFLVGPMGAGKTTIGRLLADELNRPFFDSDRVIEQRCGANIPWIFDVEGEEGFRNREQNVIDEMTQQDNIVLATGGGAVMRPENRQHLFDRGVVIYLRTTVKQQIQRTKKDKNRPLLQTDNPSKVLSDLFAQRDPLYQSIAHIVLESGRHHPRWVINELKKRIDALVKEKNNENTTP